MGGALFEELLAQHRGQVPLFDWAERHGEPLRNVEGNMRLTGGLKVLLVVEDGSDLDYVKVDLPSSGFEAQPEVASGESGEG